MGSGFWGMSVEQAEQHADRVGGATGIAVSQGIGDGAVPSPISAVGLLLGGHLGEHDGPIDQILLSAATPSPYLP